MKNHDRASPGVYLYINTATGVREYRTTPNWLIDSFSHTGFGSGNFHTPVSGSFTKQVTTNWSGELNNYVQNGREYKYGNMLYPGYSRGVPSFNWTSLENQAKEKFFNQIRGSLDLSVDFFEAGKTRKMVKDAANLVNFVKKFHPNQWAKSWLEYKYGWQPLLGSIYGVVDEFMKPTRGAGVKIEAVATDSDNSLGSSSGFPLKNGYDDISDSRRVKVGAIFTLTKPSALQQLSGYTSLNPASIAWELAPFSFIADWFINIGGYLRTLESSVLYMNNISDAYVTRTRRFEVMSATWGPISSSDGHMHASTIYSYKNRSAGLTLPSLPVFDARLGWQRLVSAGALLYEHFSKR